MPNAVRGSILSKTCKFSFSAQRKDIQQHNASVLSLFFKKHLFVYFFRYVRIRTRIYLFYWLLNLFSCFFVQINYNNKTNYPTKNNNDIQPTCNKTSTKTNFSSDEMERSKVTVGTAALLDYLFLIENPIHASNNNDINSNCSVEYSFCLGSDAFFDLTDYKWKDSKRIIQLLNGRFIVFSRRPSIATMMTESYIENGNNKNTSSSTLPSTSSVYIQLQQQIQNRIKEHDLKNTIWIPLNATLNDISSSRVRQCSDVQELSTMVCEPVVQYIVRNQLYQFGQLSSSS